MKNNLKNNSIFNKYIKFFLFLWLVAIIYEIIFMSTKFGLENFFYENSILYIAFISIPLVFLLAFLTAWIIAAHFSEIKNACSTENGRAKLRDEFKLLGIGVIFFIIIAIGYLITYKITGFFG